MFFRPVLGVFLVFGLLVLGGWFVLQKKGNVKTPAVDDIQEKVQVAASYSFFVTVDGIGLNVDVADTPEKKAQGLSGRIGMGEDEGMLFVYDAPGLYTFWMKDMLFSIDIIWINENYEIVDIAKNALPDSFLQTFQPQKPAQYVLEVNAGFSDRNNIQIGSRVDFSEIFIGSKFKELVFVVDAKNDEVIVLTKEGGIIKRIKVDHSPHDIALSPNSKFIVTANFHSNTINIIDVQSLSLQKTIATGDGAHGVVFSPDGRFLFVVNAREDTLSIIETATFTQQTKINVGSYPEYVGVTKDGSKVFTTNLSDGGSITVLQNIGFESKVIKEISSDVDPHGWAISPDGSKVIITTLGSNSAYLYDSSTFEEISHFDIGAPSEFAAFRTNNEVWVTNIGANYISIIEITQNTILDQIAVGETPHGISFSSDKTLAFVPLYQPGEVVIIDTVERKVIKKVKVGEELHNAVVVKSR